MSLIPYLVVVTLEKVISMAILGFSQLLQLECVSFAISLVFQSNPF